MPRAEQQPGEYKPGPGIAGIFNEIQASPVQFLNRTIDDCRKHKQYARGEGQHSNIGKKGNEKRAKGRKESCQRDPFHIFSTALLVPHGFEVIQVRDGQGSGHQQTVHPITYESCDVSPFGTEQQGGELKQKEGKRQENDG
jgi:hypothetical protein